MSKTERKGEPLMVYVPTGTKAQLTVHAGRLTEQRRSRVTLTDVVKMAISQWLEDQPVPK